MGEEGTSTLFIRMHFNTHLFYKNSQAIKILIIRQTLQQLTTISKGCVYIISLLKQRREGVDSV